ncbi:serine/threonine-protein kinase [Kitasatospora viridis]|uniref:non-specific serine/threonine protein kinase n=1 Tax=Kitasatospora viridis TaxID=281105 RepID=A0A561UJK3_9ACTN|nr:serine/threonine-protein kinase [Kitasatospora viridis]TWF99526.1 serine/threonine protein kinase [Kitasatospora viridis]
MTQPQGTSGRVLADRYRLDSVLGSGGMGTVWKAEDEMLGRIVAVKELRMHGGVDEDERHRLIVRTLREAKATARIRHTAAVTVFDVVEEDDRPWIVMELVDGRSLAEVVKQDGPVTPVRAAEIGLELLGVLGAAHAQGILHRDVKPSNVLIGEDGRVVLTDFGIASVEGDASVTSTGMLVGAPSYISPERARGQKPGPPADLWSLGGTLYAALEGKPPYDRGSALATLTAVMTEELPPAANAGPLQPVIAGLLEKDPAKRLDASATRSMLKRIIAGSTLRAESTTQTAVAATAATAEQPAVDGAVEQAAGPKKPKKPKKATEKIPGLSTVRVGSTAAAAEEPAAPAPAPAPAAQAHGGWTRSATLGAARRWSKRRQLLVAVLVLVLLVAGGVWIAAAQGSGDDSRAKPGSDSTKAAGSVAAAPATGAAPSSPTAASSGPAPSGPAAPGTAPAGGAPSSPAAASSPAAPSSAAPASLQAPPAGPTVPAGYQLYTDPAGFSLQLPSWLAYDAAASGPDSHVLSGNNVRLQIDWTDHPGTSAVGAWQAEEGQVAPTLTNYHRIQLQTVTGWRWSNAADWEWTFGTGTVKHSLNRGFVTGKYGYALYWTANDSDWNSADLSQARQTAFDSFQPAN